MGALVSAPISSMLTVARLEMPHHSPNFSAARATARSPCQWNTRCSAVGERISGNALLRPRIVTEVSIVCHAGEHVGHEIASAKAAVLRVLVSSSSAAPSI